ncbi:MAG TPA: hydrolase [Aliidongia sp.]|uniref:hydrolase n=1 Tax=Aliidongia sp. TaxID=1914230 RepID=UPI002DDDB13B|nr:hydrolase [Aliidongia sp.]HEV2675317.1 hydrolase [Aliidongia sp.]
MDTLDPRTTALVLIDLQKGILPFGQGPRSGAEVLAAAGPLAIRCREVGAPVVLVRVGWAPDFADAPKQPVDRAPPLPAGGLSSDWWDLPEELAPTDSDIRIIKRQWGAFYGTELDLQLRRRGVSTIVLGGISTNIGVESTARQAWEQGYSLVLAEDAMSAASADLHRFSIDNIMPRLGRIRSSAEIRAAL